MRRKQIKTRFVNSRVFNIAVVMAILGFVFHSGCSKSDTKARPESTTENVVTEMNIQTGSSKKPSGSATEKAPMDPDVKSETEKDKPSDVDTLPFNDGASDDSAAPGLNSPG